MSTNQIQRGENLTLHAPKAIKSNDPIQIGDIRGIALTDAATGEYFDLNTIGVHRLPKVSADVFTVGAKVYISATGLATVTAGDDPVFGVAVEPAGVGVGHVAVRIASF